MEYVHLCVNTSFNATCSTSSTTILVWRLSTTSGAATFTRGTVTQQMIGDFLLVLLSQNPYESTATLSNVESHHNGTILVCANTTSKPSPSEMATITLLVQGIILHILYYVISRTTSYTLRKNGNKCNSNSGPPSPPLAPKFLPKSLTSVKMTWDPPTDYCLCVSSYTITLTNVTEGNVSYIYQTTTNTTSMTVSGLTLGAEYSFVVAGVDTGGRVGEKSVASDELTLDSESIITQVFFFNQINKI